MPVEGKDAPLRICEGGISLQGFRKGELREELTGLTDKIYLRCNQILRGSNIADLVPCFRVAIQNVCRHIVACLAIGGTILLFCEGFKINVFFPVLLAIAANFGISAKKYFRASRVVGSSIGNARHCRRRNQSSLKFSLNFTCARSIGGQSSTACNCPRICLIVDEQFTTILVFARRASALGLCGLVWKPPSQD